jgi:maltooligosyltrehalose synthase
VTSTRILEALLAFMLALGILGSILLNTDRILPKNPCSIAATTSLLADSQIPDEFLKGAWDPDSEQLDKTFADHHFHLGWWEKEDEKGSDTARRFFAIDHASTAKGV